MADHTHNALGSMSYALANIVAPAVDPTDPIAQEQLVSAVRYLDFLQQRIDLLAPFHRCELRQHMSLANSVRPVASALDPSLEQALCAAVVTAEALLATPGARIAD